MHMRPTCNGNTVLQCLERRNAIKICNEIMFNFYPGLPHMYCIEVPWLQATQYVQSEPHQRLIGLFHFLLFSSKKTTCTSSNRAGVACQTLNWQYSSMHKTYPYFKHTTIASSGGFSVTGTNWVLHDIVCNNTVNSLTCYELLLPPHTWCGVLPARGHQCCASD